MFIWNQKGALGLGGIVAVMAGFGLIGAMKQVVLVEQRRRSRYGYKELRLWRNERPVWTCEGNE